MCRLEPGRKLAGILYFHRISDVTTGGIPSRNFGMFEKLCGEDALQNLVIVTNLWGEVDPQIGDEREAELASSDTFFKPVLDQGAQMARHGNTVDSAEEIIRLILDHHPLPPGFQRVWKPVVSVTNCGRYEPDRHPNMNLAGEDSSGRRRSRFFSKIRGFVDDLFYS